MFTKNQRYSFKKGFPAKSFSCDLFNLRFQRNDNKFSCAFVIGNKIDKGSVVRHKIKRRYAHALREILKNKDTMYDLVFFIKTASLEKEYNTIKQEIIDALRKTGILVNPEPSI